MGYSVLKISETALFGFKNVVINVFENPSIRNGRRVGKQLSPLENWRCLSTHKSHEIMKSSRGRSQIFILFTARFLFRFIGSCLNDLDPNELFVDHTFTMFISNLCYMNW